MNDEDKTLAKIQSYLLSLGMPYFAILEAD